MASSVELDRDLHSIWDLITHDTIVGADLALYNAYRFRYLENASLPFRCHSERKHPRHSSTQKPHAARMREEATHNPRGWEIINE